MACWHVRTSFWLPLFRFQGPSQRAHTSQGDGGAVPLGRRPRHCAADGRLAWSAPRCVFRAAPQSRTIWELLSRSFVEAPRQARMAGHAEAPRALHADRQADAGTDRRVLRRRYAVVGQPYLPIAGDQVGAVPPPVDAEGLAEP